MDFRVIVLSLLLWLPSLWANATPSLNQLAQQVYPYPAQTLSQINSLERQHLAIYDEGIPQLQLALLKCEAFIQQNEHEAALNIARMHEARAKANQIPQAVPYFLNCMAAAFMQSGDVRQALPILDKAVLLSREQQQPQSLVNALLLRANIDIGTESYSSALEDLRLATDIYPDTTKQAVNWLTPPKAYVDIAMANLLAQRNQTNQAYQIVLRSLDQPQVVGKVKLAVTLSLANIAQQNNQIANRDAFILEAKNLLPELGTAVELASSYQQLAQLEFQRGNNKSAKQFLELALNSFNKHKRTLGELTTRRSLAQLALATGDEAEGLALMQQVITQAIRTAKYEQLNLAYQILSDYYAQQGNYQQAYEYQLLRYDAASNAYNFLKDTRLLQLKARLSRQQQLVRAQQVTSMPLLGNRLGSGYIIGAIFLLVSIASLVIFIRSRSKPLSSLTAPPANTPLDEQQQMEQLLQSAKQSGFAISLLLIDLTKAYPGDRAVIKDILVSKLRDQDRYHINEQEQLVIMLPFTLNKGAMNVAAQLSRALSPLMPDEHLTIGLAVMQQQDGLTSLIKRAEINQVSNMKRHNQHKIPH
ncbi:tetratricopeptide repeat protein [Shewanella waksmanii]|uniref:tetratricopeptide repeat protein n=1 Tax=Shewanella waksmanii TaxID=213783 RepID=UPI00373523F6